MRLLDLRPEIRIGVMMLAISPGGLFALQFARVSKGNRLFAVALVIVLCVSAILITPLVMFFATSMQHDRGWVCGGSSRQAVGGSALHTWERVRVA